MDEYRSYLSSSLATAELIQDNEYLQVMLDEIQHEDFVMVYSLSRPDLPIIIDRDRDFTLYELAQLYCKTEPSFEMPQFYQLIEKYCGELEPMSFLTQFDMYVRQIHDRLKTSERKVHRNDPCPCGSGEKFKNCHGNTLTA